MRPTALLRELLCFFFFVIIYIPADVAALQEPNIFLTCKMQPYSNVCVAWGVSQETAASIPQNLFAGSYLATHCGISDLTTISWMPEFVQVKTFDNEEKSIYCKLSDIEIQGKNNDDVKRVRRQASFTPRGRYRGQTQSQYLAIDRGNGKDEGKAEAHSDADSSRASVSGNSGMGQAQSQTMYDPNCEECKGGRQVEEAESLRRPGSSAGETFEPGGSGGFEPGQNGIPREYGPRQTATPGGSRRYDPSQGGNNGGYGPGQARGPGGNGARDPGGNGLSSPEGTGDYGRGQGGPVTGTGAYAPDQGGASGSPGGYGPHQGTGGYGPGQIAPSGGTGVYRPNQGRPSGGTGDYGLGQSGPSGGSVSYGPGQGVPSTGTSGYTPSPGGPSTGNGGYGPSQIGPSRDTTSGGNVGYGPGQGGPAGGTGGYGPAQGGLSRGSGDYGPGRGGPAWGTGGYGPVQGGPAGSIGGYGPGQGGTPGGTVGIGHGQEGPSGSYGPGQGGPSVTGFYNPTQGGPSETAGPYGPGQGRPSSGVGGYIPGQDGISAGVFGPSQGGPSRGSSGYGPFGQGSPSGGPGSYGQGQRGYLPGQNFINQGVIPGPTGTNFGNGRPNYICCSVDPNNDSQFLRVGGNGVLSPNGIYGALGPNGNPMGSSPYVPGISAPYGTAGGPYGVGRPQTSTGGTNGYDAGTPPGVSGGTYGMNGPYSTTGSGAPSGSVVGQLTGAGRPYGTTDGSYGVTGGVNRPYGTEGNGMPLTGDTAGPYGISGTGTPYSTRGGSEPSGVGGILGTGTGNALTRTQAGPGTYEATLGKGVPYGNTGAIGGPQTGENGVPFSSTGGSNGPYGTAGSTGSPYGTGRPPGGPYGTNGGVNGPYGSTGGAGAGPHVSTVGTSGPYGTFGSTGGPYGTNGDAAGPYGTSGDTRVPYGITGGGNAPYGSTGGTGGPTGNTLGSNGVGTGNNIVPGSGSGIPGTNSGSGNGGGPAGQYGSTGTGTQGGYNPNSNGHIGNGYNQETGIMGSGYGIGAGQQIPGQVTDNAGVPQNVIDPNSIANTDDDSEAEASVSQSVNGTIANASSRGGNDKGLAQTNVNGAYTGSGSFSAQAEISSDNKAANSQVTGDKKGASSTAQGSGKNNKSQANVQLGSETGSILTGSQSEGAMHSSNTQVQGSVKGGMADAQARGPGSTSSQAQIGFTPYKQGDTSHESQKIPFVGGGTSSAQSNGRTGMSQSQLHGSFKYGITYNGAAQSGASLSKDAVFPNRLPFEKIDVYDENNKNINVDLLNTDKTEDPESEVPSTETDSSYITTVTPDKQYDNSLNTEGNDDYDDGHTHLDHHKTDIEKITPSKLPPVESRRSFQTTYTTNNADYEYTTDKDEPPPDDYDVDDGFGPESEQNEFYNDLPHDPETHQSLNSPRKKGLDIKQTTGGNTQHIVLGSLKDHDAEITQRNSERPDESKIYQPGERIPGTGGYTIPLGFTGSVKSVASKDKTYVVGSKDSPSQAQTVTLTPGTGRVKYNPSYGRYVHPKDLRSLSSHRSDDDRYLSVSKSVTRSLDDQNNIRKQYSHTYYTKSSSCGYFTFTCTMVSGADGKKKVCRPKIPTNPDGSPIKC